MIAKRLPRLAKTSLACLALAGLAVSASADDLYWEHNPADPGNWFDTANWSTLALPSSADSAYIDNGGTAGISSGNATAAYLYAGYSQRGTVRHSAGTNTVQGEPIVIGGETYYLGGELHLGHLSGSDGTYELSGIGLLSALTEYVGHAGTGTFRQSDGTNDVVDWLCIGAWVTGSGSYELSGTAELSAGSEQVGLLGRGTFTQSGGTNTVATALIVGGALGPTSTYTLTDGRLSALNEYIGFEGIATFTHSGGTNTVGEELVLGYKGGSSGTYELTGTDSHLSVQNEYVGYEDRGTFLQTAGSHTVAGALYIGHETNSNGACEISGGSLDVADLVVGLNGEGELTVSSGGTVEVGDTLRIVWGGGTVNLQNGGSIVAGTFDNSGTGAFNFTGGTLAVTTFLGDLVCAGGTIAPGASPGITTVSGDLTMDSGTIRIEISGSGSPPVAGTDRVDVTGALTLDNDTDLEFVFGAADPFEAGTYTLASYDTLVGTFSSVTSLGDYSTGVVYGANAITIDLLAGLLAGDATLDRTVDLNDFARLRNNFGTGDTWIEADFNGDYTVNLNDIAILRNNFGSSAPEPATLAWDSGTGNWADNNWSGSQAPTASAAMTIDAASDDSVVTVAADFITGGTGPAASLAIGETNTASLTVNGDVTLEVTGDVDIGGSGTMFVNGTLTTAGVTAASGATLGGGGTIGGATTVESGGTLTPGASVGTLTIDNDLTFENGGNNWVAELLGADADRVDVTGTLTLGDATALEFVFGAANPFQAGTYTLASYGTRDGTFSSVTDLGAYSTGVVYGANAITIDLLAGLLAGDATLDRTVDLNDFARLRNNFGTGDTWVKADFNGDYTVDLNDFAILRNNFGSSAPEPATLLLMGAGLALAIARKHNGRRD